ncbi:MAG: UDP-N-acetylmuramoyl-L-alanyl-D-glutamate--2,6-diaminopimelate ligase [Chlamydiota bacterium]
MKLSALLHKLDVQIKGKKDLVVTGIAIHSKQVAPGNLFVAKKGEKTDGSLFIDEALEGGACAILTDLYNPFLTHVTQVITKDPSLLQGEIARRFYQDPSQKLFLVGITGTNGKTTTSYIIKHLLEEKKAPCGLIGTIENILGDHHLPSQLTTPDVITLNKYFYEMLHKGCESAVMEVSSHALIQNRIEAIEFDVAVFTNLSQDHLDYHKTMDNYAAAKKMLFSHLTSLQSKAFVKTSIVNIDDLLGKSLVKEIESKIISYGIDNAQADLQAKHLKMSFEGSSFTLIYQGEEILIKTALIGRFNVYNCLAAVGAALAKGLSLKQIQTKLKTFKGVPGRLQKIPTQNGIHVYVDFAHTPQALESVCTTLKELTKGSLISVFGCGGDRDKDKRPKMASVAEKYCDRMIFTSDNPRREDPEKIIQEMLCGVLSPNKVMVEIDRKQAILQAMSLATKKDIVIIAGKGHESTQIFKDKTIAFSDVDIVKQK